MNEMYDCSGCFDRFGGVVEPRYADPLSLIYYNKIVVTKAAVAKLEEMLG